jgi:hypothetical protein
VEPNQEPRISLISEIRAWLLVSVAFLAQLVGSVWWAATLSSDIKNLSLNFAEVKKDLAGAYPESRAANEFALIHRTTQDHESRIRSLEGKR